MTSFIQGIGSVKARAKAVSEGRDQEDPCPHTTKELMDLALPANFVSDIKVAASKCWPYYS
jgi:hypothetical protein